MKYTQLILVSLCLYSLCSSLVHSSEHNSNSPLEEKKRKYDSRFGLSDDSFENTGEDEFEEDSTEYMPLGPPGINAYLFGRSIRKGGFNAWAGRRDTDRERAGEHRHGKRSKKFRMRHRRRPWGGQA